VERTKRLPPAGAAVALLVGLSTALRLYAGTRIDGLWIAPDEMIYASLGQSLWEDGKMTIFGGPTGFYSLVYPALAGLPFVLFGLEDGYEVLKALQALVMSLTAVPVYLWARRLASPWWAVVAAVLTLAVPALLYAGLIMTEVAFYPALVLAAWATAAALERPSLGRQALLVGAIVLAAATRLQALVLVPVVLSAVGLAALLERAPRLPLRFWPALVGLAVPALAWFAWRAAASGWEGVLGSYAAAADSDYALGEASRFVVYHFADLLLLTAFFPVCAVALLAWEAFRGRERSKAARAYVATAVPLTVWLVVEVGVFASENVNQLAERDLIGIVPVLFVGFAVWLARGAPRPRVATALVALAALGALLALPLRRLVVDAAIPDAFALVPFIWLREHVADTTFELVVWLAAAAAAVVFVLAPRRAATALPIIVALVVGYSSVAATREVSQRAAFDQENFLGGERGWVDRVADEPVAYLYFGERYWPGVWQELFWNRRIRRVYVPQGIVLPPGLPLTVVRIQPDGRFLLPGGSRVPERLMVASSRQRLRGEPVASIEQRFLEEPGLTLWRLRQPPRLDSVLTGVRSEGDMHGPAVMRVWDCRDGRLELTLLPKLSSRVELRVNGRTERVLTLAGEPYVNTTLFPPPDERYCTFEVVPDSLLGSTRFEFVRD
jgi:Dolichyl-phosphate-mannose-protein mannosyltransferase